MGELYKDRTLKTKVYNAMPEGVQKVLDELGFYANNFRNSAVGKTLGSLIPTDATQAFGVPVGLKNAEAWYGIEDAINTLSKGTYGYGKQVPKFIMKRVSVKSSSIEPPYGGMSNFDKFLQKSVSEQDEIVRYWNKEKYNSFKAVTGKDLDKFKDWINKQ